MEWIPAEHDDFVRPLFVDAPIRAVTSHGDKLVGGILVLVPSLRVDGFLNAERRAVGRCHVVLAQSDERRHLRRRDLLPIVDGRWQGVEERRMEEAEVKGEAACVGVEGLQRKNE